MGIFLRRHYVAWPSWEFSYGNTWPGPMGIFLRHYVAWPSWEFSYDGTTWPGLHGNFLTA